MPDRRRRKDPDQGSGGALPPEFGTLPEPAPRPGLTSPPPPPTDPPPNPSTPAGPAYAEPPNTPPHQGTDPTSEVIDLRDPTPTDTEASAAPGNGPPSQAGADAPTGQAASATPTSAGGDAGAGPESTVATAPPTTGTPVGERTDQTEEIPEWGSGAGWAPPPGSGPQTVGGPPRWGDSPRTGDIPPPPPPPPIERRRRRVWPWFLWLFILVLPLVLIIGCTVLVLSFEPGPVDAANDFMAALDEGRLEDAHQQLCPETRRATSLDQFAADFSAADQITDYRLLSMSALMTSPATVSGTVVVGSEAQSVRFEVAEIGGQWMVCAYEPIQ